MQLNQLTDDALRSLSRFCADVLQYNDAEFSDHDFINLARIGQAKKLQRATTTGRFGLGFNSVYHFTDLPAIVSAKSIGAYHAHLRREHASVTLTNDFCCSADCSLVCRNQ